MNYFRNAKEEGRRVWVITCQKDGFTYKVFLETIEEKLNSYIMTELPGAVSYSGATDKEVEAARTLHLPIYLY